MVVPLSFEWLGGRPNTYQLAGVRRGTATSNSTTNGTTSERRQSGTGRLHTRDGRRHDANEDRKRPIAGTAIRECIPALTGANSAAGLSTSQVLNYWRSSGIDGYPHDQLVGGEELHVAEHG